MAFTDAIKDDKLALSIVVVCPILILIFYLRHFSMMAFPGRKIRPLLIGHLFVFSGLLAISFFGSIHLYNGIVRGGTMMGPVDFSSLHTDFSPFNILGYSFINLETEVGSKDPEIFNCDQVQFSSFLNVTEPALIGLDLQSIRTEAKALSKSDYPIAKWCFQDEENELEEEILNTKWLKFCGSSVWLSKYQVHFFVNRIVYSKTKHRNHPTISLIYAEIFDKDWNEVQNFTIPTHDGEDLHFPSILKINIEESPRQQKEVMGAEDPRLILRLFKNENGHYEEEPVIIFNMRSNKIKWSRAMHMYRPFTGETVRLSIKGREPRFREKNWAPFFNDQDDDHIYFVYNFNPLRVVKCLIKDGVCELISGPAFIDSDADESEHVGALRGGTDIIRIPNDAIPPHFKHRDFWFGIARSHVSGCGCLDEIYRPHGFIISKDKSDSFFSLDYVSSLFDLNVNAEPWDTTKSRCDDGKSVLIPNSIAYWVAAPDSPSSEDLMGITFSEADRTNKIVHVQGFLKHIRGILDATDAKGHYDTTDIDAENAVLGRCSTIKADAYCKYSEKVFKW